MSNDLTLQFNVSAHSTLSVVIEMHNVPGPVDWMIMNNVELQPTSLCGIRTAGTYHYDVNSRSIFVHPFDTTLGISLTIHMY